MKKNYWKPTPAKWRKLGDSLLALSTAITAVGITDEWDKWIQILSLLLGVAGKFLTNFFTK